MINKFLNTGHPQVGSAVTEHPAKKLNQHLDLENLLENLDSEVDVVMDLLKIIPKQLMNDMNALEEAIRRNNVIGLKYSIHNLIGVSLNMYFNQLTELARMFELEIENNNRQVLSELLGEMVLEMKLVEQEITNFEIQRTSRAV
jgi:HPt (histidine-containing phosphotransfer) domain-containing protein